MKPRNKLQKRVDSLFRTLPILTEKQKAYAIDKLFDKDCMMVKSSCWCLCCGGTFENKGYQKGDKIICPSCGREIVAKRTKKRKFEDEQYYTVATTKGGLQVFRLFLVRKYMVKILSTIDGCQEPSYSFTEVVQQWVDDSGKSAYVARPRMMSFNCDQWNLNKPMEIRECKGYTNPYEICGRAVYPGKVIPILRKYGFTYRANAHVYALAIRLLTNNEAEMLIKSKQYELLKFFHLKKYINVPHLHAVKICNRNGYIVKDASMWHDYLVLLEYFHLDTHNAHYVCPKDLKAEHDKLMRRKERILAEERRVAELKEKENRILKARKYEEKYQQAKGKYFGLCFGDEEVTISVLESVRSFLEEGEAMKHCVFTADYYKKKDSLILSARDKDGNRLETIEISLKTFNVLQSRGKHNGVTKYHQHILELMEKNKKLIIKRAS